MNLNEYFDCLGDFLKSAKHKIVVGLFEIGNAKNLPSDETARSWFKKGKGKRNCRVNDYFDKEHLPHKENVICYLQTNINTNWNKLQAEFKKHKDTDLINTVTNDQDDFFESLYYQFLKILNLPISEDYLKKIKSQNDIFSDLSNNNTELRNIPDPFNNGNSKSDGVSYTYAHKAGECPLETVIDTERTVFSEIAIPPELRLCLCCKNWSGNFLNGLRNKDGVFGNCKVFDQKTLSINGKTCDRFLANFGHILKYEQFNRMPKM